MTTTTAMVRSEDEGLDNPQLPVCFVIMPISDADPYPAGHFRLVYDHLIAPACIQAGFVPILASDVKQTNMIVLDILERLYGAEMVLCDLSARNPNVLFELGFRQAFNKPVTLIKDDITERIFDVSGLRDISYDHMLRIDTTQTAISEIVSQLKATYEMSTNYSGGINSLVQLLGIKAASAPQRSELSDETQIILNAIRAVQDQLKNRNSRTEVQRLTTANDDETEANRLVDLLRADPGVAWVSADKLWTGQYAIYFAMQGDALR